VVPLNRLKAPVLLLAVLALSACHVGNNPRPELVHADTAAAMDIRATSAVYKDALVHGDPRRIGPLLTPDALVAESGAGDVIGPAAVLAGLREFFEIGGRITRLEMETQELHVDGGVAFEFGTFEAGYTVVEGEEQIMRGRHVIRWEQGPEARWRISRFLVNHLPPPEPDDTAGD
jgi:ketosteroid isomerase-like protein